MRVTVHPDGQIDLLDIASGRQAPGLNRIRDEADAGDLYEHGRLVGRSAATTVPGALRILENSDLRGTIQVSTEILCNGASCPLDIRVSLAAGGRLVSIQVTLDNRAGDHWLRAAAAVPGGQGRLWAHTPFDLVRRGTSDGEPYAQEDRIRFGGRLGQPMQWGVCAESEWGLLALASRGLYEYTYETPGEVSLSLMRFVGLIREDLTAYPATGANRRGPQNAEYAVGFWPPAGRDEAMRALQAYNVPLRSMQFFGPLPSVPAAGLNLSNPRLGVVGLEARRNRRWRGRALLERGRRRPGGTHRVRRRRWRCAVGPAG